jgi:cyclophilin family peptidyl-prolyl cis-trans isomerase
MMYDAFSHRRRRGGTQKALVFGLSALLGLCIAVMIYLLAGGTGPSGSGSDAADGLPDPNRPRVKLETNHGDIIVELDRIRAPISSENFLAYVADGHYDGTIFHRVVPNFCIQGGGYDAKLKEKPTRPPILNEADNGLKNIRGSLAMARTTDPNSATAQFYINLKDNEDLDYGKGRRLPGRPPEAGYAVLGKVVIGMDVVDKIAKVRTKAVGLEHQNMPADSVVIKSAKRL